MLRLAVTGFPGSRHLEVGRELAARLDIPYVTAKQHATEWCRLNNVNYYMFKNHYDDVADKYVSQKLIDDYVSYGGTNIVIDMLQAQQCANCITVFFTRNLVDMPEFSKSLYEESLQEIKLMADDDLFDETKYDMSFPSVYIPVKTVLDTIITSIRNADFEGHYKHPYQLLPLYPQIKKLNIPDIINEDIVFDVVAYGLNYYLSNPDQYGDYVLYLRHSRRMRVKVERGFLSYNELSPTEAYLWLKEFIPEEAFTRLELCNRLARYAARYGVVNHNQLYLDLSRNANALRVLREGGF